jgi:predicted ATP-dependent serine protease
MKEAHSLGFETIIMPQGNLSVIEKKERQEMNLIGVQNLKQAINHIF